MTATKAQAVTSAIIGAGFQANAHRRADGEWVVRARSAEMNIPVGDAAGLAAAQAVTGTIADVEFV